MREAAELAETLRRFLKIERGEGVGLRAVGADPEAVEKGFCNEMRRPAQHLADPDIDARLAEINRPELRVNVGQMQDARIAEAFEIVEAWRFRGARAAGSAAEQEGCASYLQKIPPADFHCDAASHISSE